MTAEKHPPRTRLLMAGVVQLILILALMAGCAGLSAPPGSAAGTANGPAGTLPSTATAPAATGSVPARLSIPTPLPGERLPTVRYQQLPSQARQLILLIERGGPFPYRQDGAVFQNREGILPHKPADYYKEYTVVTPGSSDRGARRIVAGAQGELYYTDDHYASFDRVMP